MAARSIGFATVEADYSGKSEFDASNRWLLKVLGQDRYLRQCFVPLACPEQQLS
jgi:hypothetical protein